MDNLTHYEYFPLPCLLVLCFLIFLTTPRLPLNFWYGITTTSPYFQLHSQNDSLCFKGARLISTNNT